LPALRRIGVSDGEAFEKRRLAAAGRGEKRQARTAGDDGADGLAFLLSFLFFRGDIEMQRHEEVFQPEAARADIIIRRQAVEVDETTLVFEVLPVGCKSVQDMRVGVLA